MDGCSLFALLACFSWGNLYLDGGLSWQDVGLPATYTAPYRVTLDDGREAAVIPIQYVAYYRDNPYANVALGYEINFRNFSVAVEASHRSSVAVGYDDGINSIGLRARWHPFR